MEKYIAIESVGIYISIYLGMSTRLFEVMYPERKDSYNIGANGILLW